MLAPVFFVAVMAVNGAVLATENDAARFIHQLGNRAIETLRTSDLTLDQREAQFRGLLREGFDLAFIGRFVLGKYWRAATPEQQEDYLALFGEYLVQTYSARLGGYSGETMAVVSTRQASEKDFVVRTQIDRPTGPPVVAKWRVRTTGGGFRIIDVMVEGISMAVTQRSEFASVVQRDGIDGLLVILRARTTKIPATTSLY